MREHSRSQAGFSLIELVVAMAVTLIVSSAIYGLIAAGNTSFRREPEISDRQQNIRLAMALITRDLHQAGNGLLPFSQAFTNNLDGVGPDGPAGDRADELEIISMTECDPLPVCSPSSGKTTGASVFTKTPLSPCYQFPSLVILANSEKQDFFWATKPGEGSAGGSCKDGGESTGHVAVPTGMDRFHNPPGGPDFLADTMTVAQVVRYRIQIDADGVPNLMRSGFGGEDFPPSAGGGTSWQLVARGIEDLQVSYQNGLGWGDTPGSVSCGANCASPGDPEYNTIVRRVRVTLSGRTTVANLAGETTSAVGNAIRGQLVGEVSPRAALLELQNGGRWF